MQPRTERDVMAHVPGSCWSGREGAVVWWEERGGTHAGMAGRAEAVAVGGGSAPRGVTLSGPVWQAAGHAAAYLPTYRIR